MPVERIDYCSDQEFEQARDMESNEAQQWDDRRQAEEAEAQMMEEEAQRDQAQSGRVDCYTEPAVQGDLVAEDPKYLLTESEILEIVDGCFHCYASSYRIEAADLTRKILLSKQTV